jgi:hypothetical protein
VAASADRRRLAVLAAVCSVALFAALALSFSKSGHHRTGTNGMPRQVPTVVPAHRQVCQGAELFGPGTARVRFFPGPTRRPVGPFTVALVPIDGGPPHTGRVPARPYRQSEAAVASVPAFANAVGGSVCITDAGPKDAAVIGDYAIGPFDAALLQPVAKPPPPPPWTRMHFDYEQRHAKTWWTFAPTIARRYHLVKATFFGAWTFWATLVALLALALGAVWWAARAIAR